MHAIVLREQVRKARVARLATVDPDGRPHLVPIVFVLEGETHSAVDAKPKRSLRLRRVENARERPDVTVLINPHEDDWERLWWIKLRGRARVLDTGEEAGRALRLLADKYEQYRRQPPATRSLESMSASGAAGTPRPRHSAPTGEDEDWNGPGSAERGSVERCGRAPSGTSRSSPLREGRRTP